MAWLGEFLTRDINSLRIRSTCGGNSAWHKAAKGSQLDVIKHMAEVIQRYFDNPQSKDLADERYQLLRMGATAKDVIKHLINVPNFKGVTPLMHAASRGNSELVQWLLAYGKHRSPIAQHHQYLPCNSSSRCFQNAKANDTELQDRCWFCYHRCVLQWSTAATEVCVDVWQSDQRAVFGMAAMI